MRDLIKQLREKAIQKFNEFPDDVRQSSVIHQGMDADQMSKRMAAIETEAVINTCDVILGERNFVAGIDAPPEFRQKNQKEEFISEHRRQAALYLKDGQFRKAVACIVKASKEEIFKRELP